MGSTAANGPGRLRPRHRAPETRDARHPLSLSRPTHGVTHPRHRRGPVRLSAVRLERGYCPSNQIEPNIGSKDRWEFDRLDDIAIERIHVNVTGLDHRRFSFLLLLFGVLRRL